MSVPATVARWVMDNGRMRPMTLLGAILILLILAAGPASADPVALPATALHDRPGVVSVDAQDVTTITFCRAIAWSAYKAPWLHATVSAQDKRVLLLDGTATSGETTLMVWIEGDGMPLQLLVRASAQELGNHLYTVTCPPVAAQVVTPSNPVAPPVRTDGTKPSNVAPPSNPPNPHSASASSAPQAQAAAWDAFTKGLSQHQWDVLAAFVVSPTPESRAALEATLTPPQRPQWEALAASMPAQALASPTGTQPAPAAAQALPTWLPWQAIAATAGTGMLISYSLQNTGQVAVVLDSVRLRVTAADGTPIAGAVVTRRDTSGVEGRLPAGGVESGVIRIPTAPPGGVIVSWAVVALDGAGTTYQISQSLR